MFKRNVISAVALGAFVTLAFGSVIGGGGGGSSSYSSSSGTQTGKMNETVSMGDLAYTVTKATKTAKVGNDTFNEEAKAGQQFVVVEYKVKNNGKETANLLFAEGPKLEDTQGRTFDTDSDAQTSLSLSGSETTVLEVQPGIESAITAAFRLPDDAANGALTFTVSEPGLFASGKTKFQLAF